MKKSDIFPVRLKRTYRTYPKSPNGLENAYVGRPTKWGNPYWLRNSKDVKGQLDIYTYDDVLVKENGTLDEVIKLYDEHILHKYNNGEISFMELKNKNLVCWCSEHEKCHADSLIQFAKLY